MQKKEAVYNRDVMETKKQEEEENESIRGAIVPDLPLNIICEILSRLPMEDIMRYRCVCKTWCDLPKDSDLIHLQSIRSEISQHSPYLVVDYHATPYTLKFFHKSSSNGKWIDTKIQEEDMDIMRRSYKASCNGFICISEYDCGYSSTLVYNPITREKIILPKFRMSNNKYFPAGSKYGFGFDKRNNNYKLIIEFPIDSWSDVVAIITVGESSWRNIDIPSEIKEIFKRRIEGAVFFKGGFHWVFYREGDNHSVEGILTLDIISEKFQTNIFSPPLETCQHAKPFGFCDSITKLVQLGDYLSLVHQTNNSKSPPSYKLEDVKIWKILGVKDDGSCLYQFKTLRSPIHEYINVKLLNILSNGVITFEASGPRGTLVFVYDPEKNESSYVNFWPWTPENINIGTFVPTLTSFRR